MATLAELGRTRYEQVSLTVRAVIEQIQRLWQGLSAESIEGDLLGRAGADIVDAVVQGQLTVADAAQAYIAAQMAAQGGSALAEATLLAAAFGGVAPDGGSLETLLFLPAIGVRRRIAAGLSPEEAMLGGLTDMAMYASTAITDTARSSEQVGMAANRSCVAYVRIVQLPACARCIVLSGRMYSYSTGFLRHPRCDCITAPLRENEWGGVPSPQQLFDRMPAAEQRRVFTNAGARAIDRGADVGQVVNARRGMSTAHLYGRDLQVTSEGTTRRGLYGRQMRRAGGEFTRTPGQRYSRSTTPRLMPEQIFQIADNRDDEIHLLRRNGYLV
ncbi:hypothetical protein [Streptomyces sp. NPDC047990]|uniref:hypothetical protein n=1 Tax=Streptomyces sp. NPDC047990 TaxID=3365496 RepID=UPI003723EB67